MKTGRTLEQLGAELQRQRKARQDFVADTRYMEFKVDEKGAVITLRIKGNNHTFGISELAHQQIASRLQIPYRYYQKMQEQQPALLQENVNTWLHDAPERRMIRTLDGSMRAFLSDRYRRLDNLELCAAVLPIIKSMSGAEIKSCEVTPSHMYLKVVNKRMKSEVQLGDVVQAGFVISNSEVGLGSVKVEPLIYRLVCKNGMISKDFSQRKYHVGRQVDGDAAYELYSDETLQADDKAFFMKVQDTVKVAADKSKFMLTVGKMRESSGIRLEGNPVEEVELLADRFQLTQNERGDILRQLFMGGDNSRYGLLNAVTAASQLSASYERATELERIGGEILSLPVGSKALKMRRSDDVAEGIVEELPVIRPVRAITA